MSHRQKELDNFKEIKNPWDLQHESVNKNEEPSYIYVIILFSFSSYWCRCHKRNAWRRWKEDITVRHNRETSLLLGMFLFTRLRSWTRDHHSPKLVSKELCRSIHRIQQVKCSRFFGTLRKILNCFWLICIHYTTLQAFVQNWSRWLLTNLAVAKKKV